MRTHVASIKTRRCRSDGATLLSFHRAWHGVGVSARHPIALASPCHTPGLPEKETAISAVFLPKAMDSQNSKYFIFLFWSDQEHIVVFCAAKSSSKSGQSVVLREFEWRGSKHKMLVKSDFFILANMEMSENQIPFVKTRISCHISEKLYLIVFTFCTECSCFFFLSFARSGSHLFVKLKLGATNHLVVFSKGKAMMWSAKAHLLLGTQCQYYPTNTTVWKRR